MRRERERVLPTGLQSRHVVGSVGSGWLIDLVKSHRFFMHRMNMREKGRISSMNDGCTTSWGGNLLFFWRFKKKPHYAPFFGERERLKETICVCI